LDAGALQIVRSPCAGFWRLPLSGLLLAGDAAATDPVCSLSPLRSQVDAVLAEVAAIPAADAVVQPSWLYRPNPA